MIYELLFIISLIPLCSFVFLRGLVIIRPFDYAQGMLIGNKHV
jgi:hypothetical protein